MKITKRQLRRIIKEEKSKLVETKSAERNLGLYADTVAIEALQTAFDDLLTGTEQSAYDDLEDDWDAEMAAVEAITLAVAQAFQAAGMYGQHKVLLSTLR